MKNGVYPDGCSRQLAVLVGRKHAHGTIHLLWQVSSFLVASGHCEAKSLFKQQFQLSFVSNANERGYNKGLYPSFNNVLFNINRMAFFPAVVLK